MRSRNGARHPSSRGGMNRTRGCTGLVAAPDSWLHRTHGPARTRSHSHVPHLQSGPWPVVCGHPPSSSWPPALCRSLPTLPIQPTSASTFYHPLYFSPFETREERIPSLLCLPAVSNPIQSISDSMTETGDTAAAVADTAVTNVDRVKRPTRPDDTETKRLIEDLQSTST